MAENSQISMPLLVVVTGRPGSGKTTLAYDLARAVRCPAVCRDEIKEGLINTLGQGAPHDDRDLALKANGAFFETICKLLDLRISLIAEAAFQHHLWTPKLEPFRGVARMQIIVCTVHPALARSRCIDRFKADPTREHYHPDPAVLAQREGRDAPLPTYEPPRLDVPTMTVDTSDGYRPAFEDVLSFARG